MNKIITIIAVVLIIIGVIYAINASSRPEDNGNTTEVELGNEGVVSASAVQEFNQAAYQAAIATGQPVLLYFYANWCPICRKEFPKLETAFADFADEEISAFRVNYNDNETSAEEKELAREFGVAYQHTKVIIRGDALLLKSPESWDEERYQVELTKLINDNS